MLLLLPPSEGKSAPTAGPPLDLTALTFPQLTEARRTALTALVAVSGLPDATARLGVGSTLTTEVTRNVGLAEAPTAPACEVYTGVLFAAAGLSDLDDVARERAARSVRVVSGLWGVVGPQDLLPAYRLSMATSLPATGPLASFWRPRLGEVLDPAAADDVVVDCRSATYAAAWVPPAGSSTHVTVRVEREVDGRRIVVSHWAKHARGALVGHLLNRTGTAPRTAEEVLTAAQELVGTGPIGRTAPGLMTSELHAAELRDGPRGSAVLTLVVG